MNAKLTNEHDGFFSQGKPNTAYATYFIGNSYLNPLTGPEAGIQISNVTFEPGCRNNWHIHHAKTGGGQMLICVDGKDGIRKRGKKRAS